MSDQCQSLFDVLSLPGRQSVVYEDVVGHAGRSVIPNIYRAPGCTPDSPVVLVQHGVLRNGADYRDFWVPAADKHGLLIVAPEALRQGPHRHARGHHYFVAAQQAAQRLGVSCAWRAVDVPHIGHDGRAMPAVAASLWFENRLPHDQTLTQLSTVHVA